VNAFWSDLSNLLFFVSDRDQISGIALTAMLAMSELFYIRSDS
jgi:hypothetical protein